MGQDHCYGCSHQRSSHGRQCFAQQDTVLPRLSVICCRDCLSVPTVDGSRDEKDQMRSKVQEASLFRGRGSVMRFWMFQRSDLAAQRGSKSVCVGLFSGGRQIVRHESAVALRALHADRRVRAVTSAQNGAIWWWRLGGRWQDSRLA